MAWRRPGDKRLVYWRIYASLGLNELKLKLTWWVYFHATFACWVEDGAGLGFGTMVMHFCCGKTQDGDNNINFCMILLQSVFDLQVNPML